MSLPLISAQIRAARALVRWSAEQLAREAGVSVATIRRAELTKKATLLIPATDQAIRRALEHAGIEFIEENGGGAGVRFKDPS
jgi:transcriptional regulator with XRE-family HTH domain